MSMTQHGLKLRSEELRRLISLRQATIEETSSVSRIVVGVWQE